MSIPQLFPFVESLYTTPINPKIKLSEGILIYVNTINEQAIEGLTQIGIVLNIENKF